MHYFIRRYEHARASAPAALRKYAVRFYYGHCQQELQLRHIKVLLAVLQLEGHLLWHSIHSILFILAAERFSQRYWQP